MSCEVWAAGDLEAYAFGELRGNAARAVEAHLFGCAECAAELRRLRAEQRLFRERAAADADEVPGFEGVLARLEKGAPAVAAAPQRASRADVSQAPAGSPRAPSVPAGSRAGSNAGAQRGAWSRSTGLVSAAVAVVALAAAVAGVRVNGRSGGSAMPIRPDSEVVEITAEAVCSGEAPLSMDPVTSVAPAAPSMTQGNFSREPDEPAKVEPGACSAGGAAEVCSPEPAMMFVCGDAESLCAEQP